MSKKLIVTGSAPEAKGGAKNEAEGNQAVAKQVAMMEMVYTVNENIHILTKLAAGGDESAFSSLLSIAVRGASLVTELTLEHPAVARALAAREVCWPVNITDDKLFPDVDSIRKELCIGSARVLGFNTQVRPNYKTTTPCREITVVSLLVLQTFGIMCEAQEKIKNAEALIHEFEQQFVEAKLNQEKDDEPGRTKHILNLILRDARLDARLRFEAFTKMLKKLTKLVGIPKLTKNVVTPVSTALESIFKGALPPLCARNVDPWWRATIKLLEALAPDGLHTNAVLYEIGKYKELKYLLRTKDKQKLTASDIAEARTALTGGRAAKSAGTNVSDGIRTRVKDTLIELVKEKVEPSGESSPSKTGC